MKMRRTGMMKMSMSRSVIVSSDLLSIVDRFILVPSAQQSECSTWLSNLFQDDDDLEDEDDEDAEDDLIDEEEIDPEDVVTLPAAARSEENGEELLCRHYLAGMGAAIEQEAQTEAVLAQGQRRQDMRPSSRQQQQVAHGAPPQRPITPGNNRAIGGPGSQIPGMPREDRSEQPIRAAGTVDSGPGAVDASAPPEEIQEYQEAFSTRAKLARTPQDGQRRR